MVDVHACAALALSLLVDLSVASIIHAGRPRAMSWAGPALLLWGVADLAITFVDQRVPELAGPHGGVALGGRGFALS